MIAPLLTASRRFYLRHPMQLLLAIAGVALGVAVFVGVDLANDSARRAFEQSELALFGRATHQLVGVGGPLSSALYRELRLQHGPLVAAPVIETEARIVGAGEREYTLLGIDPLEELEFRGYASVGVNSQPSSTRLMTEPYTVLLPAALIAELGLQIGAALELQVNRQEPITVTVIGTVDDQSFDPDGLNLPIVADIATVQEIVGTESISRIDLVLDEAGVRTLQALDLPGTSLVPTASRNQVFNELARAFRINLTALSLLALLVGVFLIFATISFAVVQRRTQYGIYRALGVRRGGILASVLIEAGAIGLLATVLGIGLGQVLSHGLVEMMLRTIGDLYFSASVRAIDPAPGLYWKGLGLGLGATLVAALVPGLEATHVAPRVAMSRAALERTATQFTYRGAILALPCAGVGLSVLLMTPRSLTAAFAGLFLVIVAAALIIPLSAALLLRATRPVAEYAFGVPGSLAVRSVRSTLSRTGVATSALAVAVATVIGVGLMIGSFRGSVERWLEATLLADMYADVPDWEVAAERPLANADLRALTNLSGVRGVSLLQFARLPTVTGEVSLRAIIPGPDGWGLTITNSVDGDAVGRLAAGNGLMISESLAYRRELRVGENLALPTQAGVQNFSILAIYRDYSTNGGGVLMPMSLYQRHWQDRGVDGIGIYLDAAADPTATRAAVREMLTRQIGVQLNSTQTIRTRSLEIFDRTFQITEVLRILAGLVAFLGLLSALLAIELDRGKEIAVLRALGFTPGQVGVLTLTQTLLLGAFAGLLAIPLGIVMAALLVDVINQRAFGWGMDFLVVPGPLLVGVLLAVAASLLAGLYPAWRMSRASVVTRLREE